MRFPAALALVCSGLMLAQDAMSPPPAERTFTSPNHHYTLTVRGSEVVLRTSNGKLVWQKILPHEQGPREVLVTNDGHTILADEWINIASKHALTLVDRAGGAIAHFSADEIFQTLGVPKREVVAKASHGVWITDGPTASVDGKAVTFHSGGRTLTLRLADGHLIVSD